MAECARSRAHVPAVGVGTTAESGGVWVVEGLGGELTMVDDSTIRARVVRRMWNDGIIETSRCADIDSVTDLAVASSDEGRARELIEDEMVSNSDCPVIWGIAGQAVTLRMDRQAVAQYIHDHGGEEVLPWDLKDALEEAEASNAAELRDSG